MPCPCSGGKNLISILVTDYIQKRRGQALLFSFEYNLLPNLISNLNHYMDRALDQSCLQFLYVVRWPNIKSKYLYIQLEQRGHFFLSWLLVLFCCHSSLLDRHVRQQLYCTTSSSSFYCLKSFKSSIEADKTAVWAEENKFTTYGNALRDDYHFVPIAVETFGSWGPIGYKFITEIGTQNHLWNHQES